MIAFTAKWYGARQWTWHHARDSINHSSEQWYVLGYVPNGSLVWDAAVSFCFFVSIGTNQCSQNNLLGGNEPQPQAGVHISPAFGSYSSQATDGGFEQSWGKDYKGIMNPQFSNAVDNSLALNKCLAVTKAAGLVPAVLVINCMQLLLW